MCRDFWGVIQKRSGRGVRTCSSPRIRCLTGSEKGVDPRRLIDTRPELEQNLLDVLREHTAGDSDASRRAVDQSVAQRDGATDGRTGHAGGKAGSAPIAEDAGLLSKAEGSQDAGDGIASGSRRTVPEHCEAQAKSFLTRVSWCSASTRRRRSISAHSIATASCIRVTKCACTTTTLPQFGDGRGDSVWHL